MPIYEYRCLGCERHFEKMQKVSDEPLSICEKCGGKLEKQWSLSGFSFKGEGWYVTDYSNKGKPDSKKESASAPKTEKAEKTSAAESTKSADTASKPSTAPTTKTE